MTGWCSVTGSRSGAGAFGQAGEGRRFAAPPDGADRRVDEPGRRGVTLGGDGGPDEVGVRPRRARLDLSGEGTRLVVRGHWPAEVIAGLGRDRRRPVLHEDGGDVVATREVQVVRLTRSLLVRRAAELRADHAIGVDGRVLPGQHCLEGGNALHPLARVSLAARAESEAATLASSLARSADTLLDAARCAPAASRRAAARDRAVAARVPGGTADVLRLALGLPLGRLAALLAGPARSGDSRGRREQGLGQRRGVRRREGEGLASARQGRIGLQRRRCQSMELGLARSRRRPGHLVGCGPWGRLRGARRARARRGDPDGGGHQQRATRHRGRHVRNRAMTGVAGPTGGLPWGDSLRWTDSTERRDHNR